MARFAADPDQVSWKEQEGTRRDGLLLQRAHFVCIQVLLVGDENPGFLETVFTQTVVERNVSENRLKQYAGEPVPHTPLFGGGGESIRLHRRNGVPSPPLGGTTGRRLVNQSRSAREGKWELKRPAENGSTKLAPGPPWA